MEKNINKYKVKESNIVKLKKFMNKFDNEVLKVEDVIKKIK